MNPQMSLLYVSKTGHILALFTREAMPAKPETAPDPFVGNGLHVRGLGDPGSSANWPDYNGRDFVIPSNYLAFIQTATDPSVLVAPRNFYLDSNNSAHSLAAPPTAITLTIALSNYTIAVPTAPVAPLNFLMLITQQSQGTPLSFSGTIPVSKSTTVTVPSLPSGTNYALVFVETYQALVQKVP